MSNHSDQTSSLDEIIDILSTDTDDTECRVHLPQDVYDRIHLEHQY
jgi:hypothetical protein